MYAKLESGKMDKLTGKKVLLFGAGSSGLKSLEECNRVQAEVLGFVDNNQSLRGTVIEGYPVYTPKDIFEFPDATILIASIYVNEIRQQLYEMGIDENRIEVIQLGAIRETIEREEFFRPLLDDDEANKYLYQKLLNDAPFFAGRLGGNELECIVDYQYVLHRNIDNKECYHNNLKIYMKQGAGFFPTEDELLDQFSQLYLDDLQDVDFLWSMWLSWFENDLYQKNCPDAEIAFYNNLAIPYQFETPWTYALKGKRVLVIHPFKDSIIHNYDKRTKLFQNQKLLPDFELITLKAVQSLGEELPIYKDWFEALRYMERQVDGLEFDVALIGAGAYGFPLAAYIKRMGKKALHVGGMLQLLFGIKGKAYNYLNVYNDYWTSPQDTERPKGYQKVEQGRYW